MYNYTSHAVVCGVYGSIRAHGLVVMHLQVLVMTSHSWDALEEKEPSAPERELMIFVESQQEIEMKCHPCGIDH